MVNQEMNNIIALSVIVSASLYVCTQSLTLRIATRSSKLAVAQTEHVCNALKEQAVGGVQLNIKIVHVDASGDVKDQTGNTSTQKLPLALSGIDFTGALDEAVLSGEVDAAVHSLKDVPPDCRWSDALVIGACLGPRANPFDVQLTKDASIKSIHELPSGSMIGSASIRRQAQLKAINSSLQIINIRGNVDTRLKILEDNDVDSIVLAMAGLDRLGILNKETNTIRRHGNTDHDLHFNIIPIEEMLPGLCQGIIGVTCRRDNKELLSLLQSIDNHDARIAASTERAYLNVVQEVSPWEGRPPLAGYMRLESNSKWIFNGLLATPDGSRVLKVEKSIDKADCDAKTAQCLGLHAGEEVVKLAGDSFLDGFY